MTTPKRFSAILVSVFFFFSVSGISFAAAAPTVRSLEGRDMELPAFFAGMKGKVVVLNFWATWCPMCSSEIIGLQSFYQDYQSKGVEVVGISLDDGGAKVVKPYLAKKKVTYPVVIGNEEVAEAFGGIPGVPVSFLMNREGKVVKKMIGRQGRQRFERAIQPLL